MLSTIEEALSDLQKGKFIVVVDDNDRENEGDLIAAAEKITPEMVNFMASKGKGLICVPLTEERCHELRLEMMTENNTAVHGTAFTVSVDLLGDGCTTGISAHDRAKTISALANPNTKPEELGKPGHIFPLKAKNRGVLRRAGHTEAAVDLARMAGFQPVGVLVEIINDDGTMARMPELLEFAKKYDLKIISVADLITYRLRVDNLVERGETVEMPTEYGDFKLIVFRQLSNGLEHVALVKGEWSRDEIIPVRVHSSCVTGDIFGSKRCDCGPQLHTAMTIIEKHGKGVVIYLNQEGRGIGLFNKIHAYKLQEKGLDTVEANVALGFKSDERDYGVGASIIHSLGINGIDLITNNPAKKIGLESYDVRINSVIPIRVGGNGYNEKYLKTKVVKMGHTI